MNVMDLFKLERRWDLLAISGLLLAAALTITISTIGSAPKITWSESQVDVALSPGQSAIRNVTFTSPTVLNDVSLSVVPEISGFVTVQPNSFSSVTANDDQSVTLEFNIPVGTAPGTREGTIHVKKAHRTIAQPLKLVINISNIDPPGLPPDPGDGGKATLEGIDADQDGLRDDLQRWILSWYSLETERAALRRVAIDLQATLTAANDKASSIQASRKFLKSRECAYHVFGVNSLNFAEITRTLDELQANILNSRLRFEAYLLANKNLSGQILALEGINACS